MDERHGAISSIRHDRNNALLAWRFLLAVVVALVAEPLPSARTTPLVSVWYRGTPAGVPRPDDLAMIRATGFAAVTWPASQRAGETELRRLAAAIDLAVDVRAPERPLTMRSAVAPGSRVDVRVTALPADLLPAVVWRAVAHGARTIAFDGGEKDGVSVADVNGRLPPWVEPARRVARQLDTNARLFDRLGAGVAMKFDVTRGSAAAIDGRLFETTRDWVIIVTNVSDDRVEAVTRLPKSVPYAPWGNLLDGAAPPMAMYYEPAGPRWRLTLDGGVARIYLTSKY